MRFAFALLALAAVCSCAPQVVVDGGTDAGHDAGTPRYEVPACDEPAGPFAPFSTRCQQLVDAEGRVAVLRGINARVDGVFDASFTDGREALEPIPPFTELDAAQIEAHGFELLRLPLSWSAIEPMDTSPPTYDEAYLDRVAAVVELCRTHNIYVLLDFHQDAYSKEIGEDGAPLWAIQPPPTALLEGPLTDLGTRRLSAQVLAAFQTFFGDADPGPALRDRYAQMAAHVAARFASDDDVIGYDLYNEPVASDDQVRRVNEQTGAAIRAVDARHLLFFEPPVQPRGLLDMAALAGSPFSVPGAVYAPHVYTLSFVATDAQRMSFTRDTLRRSHVNALAEAASWHTALFIGEWGYGPFDIRAVDYCRLQLDIQDELFESSSFWLWKEFSQGHWGFWDSEGGALRAIANAVNNVPNVSRLAGWPVSESTDASGDRTYVFDGDAAITAPNIVIDRLGRCGLLATCDGVVDVSSVGLSTYAYEVPCGGPGRHQLVLHFTACLP